MNSETRSVCIIGAGAAGLCAASRCVAAGFSVTVFEQGSGIGGTWIYEDIPVDKNVHSSMYKNLIANLPKEIMAYDDFTPLPNTNFASDSNEPSPSFISQDEMLQYLKEFGKSIESLIKFNSRVVNVERNEYDTSNEKANWKVTVANSTSVDTKWKIDDQHGSLLYTCHNFDVVFVCNGHYSVPRTPEFATKYRKPAIHSHYYRDARDYSGQTICVVGAGPSGSDIALQVAEYADKVYLSHKPIPAEGNTFGSLPKNCVPVSAVTDADNDMLKLVNGQTLSDLDNVIYCTGYKYSIPFLGSKIIRTPEDGAMVSPLFAHCVHVDYYDSLFFIGINWLALPFRIFDHHVHLALAFMSHALPSEKVTLEMVKGYEENRIRDLQTNSMALKNFHRLWTEQWDYFEWIREVTISNKSNFPHLLQLKPIPLVIRMVFEDVIREMFKSLPDYKKIAYVIVDDNEFIAKKPDFN
ncbi:flavin-binding monooxygenase-like domain-containing protein [Ditylenchus destructor]|uniref:Flavin-containing monooxygenase n=1 Tax=Ditylenchus destructor TaxID=166010 RepID=A0AAD4QT05_9BILA|nr:flavin-binding monooxygenase-like domain-containing protein [Ditylenchus destructor]